MMDVTNEPMLADLERLVLEAAQEESLANTLARVQGALAADSDAPQAWESVPLAVFGASLPAAIKSCWVFVLRGGGVFGAERHPNSHQRTVALAGSARFEVFDGAAWSPKPVDADCTHLVASRSISIPPNTWHRITIGPATFVSCSFHSVEAHELIEETPVGDDLSTTRRRLYHA